MNLTFKNLSFIFLCQSLLTMVFFLGYSKLSIRLDESQSLWQTSHSLPILINSLSQNVHVPIYHTLVHYWQIFFGNDVITGRILSLIFILITIPVAFFQFKKIYNTKTAHIFTALLTLSPFIHWYSSEIRMYTILLLVTIISQTTFVKLFKEPTRERFTLYTTISVVGVYTHYFFFLVILSQIVFYLIGLKSLFNFKHFKGFIISGIITAIAFSPWVYLTTRTPGSSSDPDLTAPTSIDFFNVFSNFLFGFQTDPVNSLILSFWPITFIILILGIRKNSKISPETQYFALSAIIPLLAALIASYIVAPLFLSRYLIVALPGVYLLLARTFQIFDKNLSTKLLTVLIISLSLGSYFQLTSNHTPVKEEFQSATEYLNEEITHKDILFLTAPFIIYPVLNYYEGEARIETLPYWNRFNGEQLGDFTDVSDIKSSVRKLSRNKEKIFVMYSYDQGYEDVINNYFESSYRKLDEIYFGNQIKIQVYQNY